MDYYYYFFSLEMILADAFNCVDIAGTCGCNICHDLRNIANENNS